jgi:hypothetical protein
MRPAISPPIRARSRPTSQRSVRSRGKRRGAGPRRLRPDVEDVYPDGPTRTLHVPDVTEHLCGRVAARPLRRGRDRRRRAPPCGPTDSARARTQGPSAARRRPAPRRPAGSRRAHRAGSDRARRDGVAASSRNALLDESAREVAGPHPACARCRRRPSRVRAYVADSARSRTRSARRSAAGLRADADGRSRIDYVGARRPGPHRPRPWPTVDCLDRAAAPRSRCTSRAGSAHGPADRQRAAR